MSFAPSRTPVRTREACAEPAGLPALPRSPGPSWVLSVKVRRCVTSIALRPRHGGTQTRVLSSTARTPPARTGPASPLGAELGPDAWRFRGRGRRNRGADQYTHAAAVGTSGRVTDARDGVGDLECPSFGQPGASAPSPPPGAGHTRRGQHSRPRAGGTAGPLACSSERTGLHLTSHLGALQSAPRVRCPGADREQLQGLGAALRLQAAGPGSRGHFLRGPAERGELWTVLGFHVTSVFDLPLLTGCTYLSWTPFLDSI